MQVIKRSGELEDVRFDKITYRVQQLCGGLDNRHVDPVKIARNVINGIYDKISTSELDNLAAATSASFTTIHPDYAILASRIVVSNLHKSTKKSFSQVIKDLYEYINPETNEKAPLISDDVYKIISENSQKLDSAIINGRDYNFDYFGFKTLERAYLLKIDKKIVERPQHMFMRVAIGIHKGDIEAAIKTYDLMSEGWFTHATPTLFNAGTVKPQMSSCFVIHTKGDSIEGIYDTLKDCAKISQSAGGIGLSIHNIRAKGSYIRGTNGTSNGIVPMLRVFNDTARYVDQGGGKRKGSFAVYLEPWHADIFDFLDLKKNNGKEELRARDLFYALWTPDIFMERVKNNEDWPLFCPNEAKGLEEVYGDDFNKLFLKYEKEGKAKKIVKAQEVWKAIVNAQIETGTPYMLYKDSANEKSNQKNLGTIKSSNLCCEILEYTSKDEIAVCNLASLSLPKFASKTSFDFEKLYEVTYQATLNLNKVIDENYYPVKEAKNSNLKNRPIGIGVQGLADAFLKLKYPFESEEARQLNKDIFETIYYASLSASNYLAQKDGTYKSYKGSPASKGILQYDMWNVTPSSRWDWTKLKSKIKKHGLRNSLLVAPMPTASTSQILGNNECFEPFTSNIFTRKVLSGEFKIVNKYLLNDLIELNLWSEDLKDKIIALNGSVQNIPEIPQNIKELYKTVWEIKQKAIINMASDRGAYICQSQSMNIYMENATFAKVSSMHFYGWQKGLKTGMYYLRSKAAVDPIKFTVDEKIRSNQIEINNPSNQACNIDDPDCLTCGS